jgi:hypothetical protein
MFSTTTSGTTTKRIPDEVFAEVERELAAAEPTLAPAAPAVLEPSVDTLNELSKVVLPYVWTIAIGVWVAGLIFMNSTLPLVQCIGTGIVVAGVLSSIVFAWRSKPIRAA